jgi:hypothetical protein
LTGFSEKPAWPTKSLWAWASPCPNAVIVKGRALGVQYQ